MSFALATSVTRRCSREPNSAAILGQPKHVALCGEGLLVVPRKMARAEIVVGKRFWAPGAPTPFSDFFPYSPPAFGDMT
jgi:hypothetical protein